jgi:multicomponent Na+:H+ antiporter subunit E
MTILVWNIFLAFVWTAATGHFSAENLLLGYVLGYLILRFSRQIVGPSQYFHRVRQLAYLSCFFLKELIKANFRVALDVITPAYRMRPAIVALPLDARTDEEITMLANLVTLTPGTVCLDVSEDRRTMYIHAMFVDDPDQLRNEIKQGLERRVLELLR